MYTEIKNYAGHYILLKLAIISLQDYEKDIN